MLITIMYLLNMIYAVFLFKLTKQMIHCFLLLLAMFMSVIQVSYHSLEASIVTVFSFKDNNSKCFNMFIMTTHAYCTCKGQFFYFTRASILVNSYVFSRYVFNPHSTQSHVSTEGIQLDNKLISVSEVTKQNRHLVFSEVIIKGNVCSGLSLEQVYVTPDERMQANQTSNLKKVDIVQKIEEKNTVFV